MIQVKRALGPLSNGSRSKGHGIHGVVNKIFLEESHTARVFNNYYLKPTVEI